MVYSKGGVSCASWWTPLDWTATSREKRSLDHRGSITYSSRYSNMTVLSLRARGGLYRCSFSPGTRPFGDTSRRSFGFLYGSTSSSKIDRHQLETRISASLFGTYSTFQQCEVYVWNGLANPHLVWDSEILESDPDSLNEGTETTPEKGDVAGILVLFDRIQSSSCAFIVIVLPSVVGRHVR
jgi:hypothetical protein